MQENQPYPVLVSVNAILGRPNKQINPAKQV